ncbi:MAG TPA: hypothetical protein VJZ51_06415 [Bacilli bacterium]|nr:hypothetical protein [Bacilli bacterium]
MKKGLTEIVFILDRSGSMYGLEADTIGGFNSTLEKQKKLEGEAFVTTVLFDDQIQFLHHREPLMKIPNMTTRDYFVGGSTALLDAIGRSITGIGNIQRYTPEDYRAQKVICIIITDGMENASREYNYQSIKQMVERQKQLYGWEFIFLGANIDALATAGRMGISRDRASNYCADSKGTEVNYEALNDVISDVRCFKQVKENWNQKIDADYMKRKQN